MWLHEDCIIDSVLTKVWNDKVVASIEGTPKKKRKGAVWAGKFTGVIEERGDGEEHTIIRITDLKDRKRVEWRERIRCLKCGSVLD